MKKSAVVVWLLIALGVVSGVASTAMLIGALFIWTAPRRKLLELDVERDAAGVFVYRSIPLLLLSVLILASTSIVGWIKAADLRPRGGSES
jgi:heme O synthase-like polyprenyltransferase